MAEWFKAAVLKRDSAVSASTTIQSNPLFSQGLAPFLISPGFSRFHPFLTGCSDKIVTMPSKTSCSTVGR
jgi:hypothetical protein